MGLRPDALAGAIDAAGGLVLATAFDTALKGTFVRNTWLGAANELGIVAARLASAGLTTVDGTAESTLGSLLGDLDATALTDGLGDRWDTGTGYFKRHASCSYTHPVADAALDLRGDLAQVDTTNVRSIEVETHRLAAPLDRREIPTRLAAMFSIPHVVAVAILHGDCRPVRFDEEHRSDPSVRHLVEATTVVRSDAFDDRLPAERAARVTVTLNDDRVLSAEAPNPIGDADYHPFGRDEILAKLDSLLDDGGRGAAEVAKAVDDLLEADDVVPVLDVLA
jgi:2-methylcitrate dehydratase PrpD